MNKFFIETKTSIRMIVGRFSGRVSDNESYQKALKSVLEKNIEVKILLLNQPNLESKAYKLLFRKSISAPQLVELRIASLETQKIIQTHLENYNHAIHFAVFDDDKFRLEIDPENYGAICSFNNKKTSAMLIKIFDEAFVKSEKITNAESILI